MKQTINSCQLNRPSALVYVTQYFLLLHVFLSFVSTFVHYLANQSIFRSTRVSFVCFFIAILMFVCFYVCFNVFLWIIYIYFFIYLFIIFIFCFVCFGGGFFLRFSFFSVLFFFSLFFSL